MRRSIGIEALAWTQTQLDWEELSAHADELTARRERESKTYCLRTDTPPESSWHDLCEPRRTMLPASSPGARRALPSLFSGDDDAETTPGIPDVVLENYRLSA